MKKIILPVSFSFPLRRCLAVSLVIDKQALSASTGNMMSHPQET